MRDKTTVAAVDYLANWDLNVAAARILGPMVRKFSENLHSYPEAVTSEEWDEILNRIATSFERIAGGQATMNHPVEGVTVPRQLAGYDEMTREGLLLFAEFFIDMWD